MAGLDKQNLPFVHLLPPLYNQRPISSNTLLIFSMLDSFLKGGVETQAITEIPGEFGSGKSQICYTLCVTANMPLDRKGLGGNVITIRAERIFQIAEHKGIAQPDEILRKRYVTSHRRRSHAIAAIENTTVAYSRKSYLAIISLKMATNSSDALAFACILSRTNSFNCDGFTVMDRGKRASMS
jgi:hypothetical protein